MPLSPDEIKRRIHAARLLRRLSQVDLNQLGAADGFGNEEMGRVERGELDFRPGKHLDPLCRYLRVPRWWFTASDLDFGGIDAPASPDEVASLLAQQNALLAEQSELIKEIRADVQLQRQLKADTDELLPVVRELIEGRRADESSPAEVSRPSKRARTKVAAKPQPR